MLSKSVCMTESTSAVGVQQDNSLKYLFIIYLSELGLCCGMWDPVS